MPDRQVDFFIAGTQKGGTTALRAKLLKHPDLAFSKQKEIHFFDREDIDWQAPPYDDLHAHFDLRQPKLFGEATPIYLYWPEAIKRIHRYNPEARLIFILRHPTYRALSAWKMERARAQETYSFSRAVSLIGRCRVRFAKGGVHRVFSYVERSCYAPQIRRLLMVFPREQLLFLTTDQLWTDEQDTLRRVCAFLGIDTSYGDTLPAQKKYIVPVDARHVPMQDAATITKLNKRFRRDIIRTADLTGLDLSGWLESGYTDPMHDR
ncbi:sulfotransferase [Thioclava sp. GXIMD4215]|uniref:sulfotransferase family protein n=1 Tax=Thioclava sp. GXIMD4215 TaxID=3131928 RepID=UPI00311ADA90